MKTRAKCKKLGSIYLKSKIKVITFKFEQKIDFSKNAKCARQTPRWCHLFLQAQNLIKFLQNLGGKKSILKVFIDLQVFGIFGPKLKKIGADSRISQFLIFPPRTLQSKGWPILLWILG